VDPNAGVLGRAAAKANRALFPALTGAQVVADMASTHAPDGHQRGLAERAGLATSHLGGGLAGYRMATAGGLLRGSAVMLGAGMLTDKVLGGAGRGIDRALGHQPHPAQVAGGAPVARGV
jgi:hypothetical protein